MKIVMASHYFASHRGGIEIVAEQLYRGLAGEGHEVSWIAGDSTPPPEQVGASTAVSLKVSNFVERKAGLPFPIPALSAIRRMKKLINHADVVVLHDCLYLINIAAFLLAKHNCLPVVIIQHIGIPHYDNPFLRTLMKLSNAVVTRPMLSSVEQVVFISRRTEARFGDLRFKRRPEVIFNGVNTGIFRPADGEDAKQALRHKFDLPEDRPAILFVGRFIENKGLSILKRMAELHSDWIWAFAGWGPLDPNNWNLENVRVFSGLGGTSLAALYSACDVFVLPSRSEAFPLVVQEALACGLPVVCTTDVLESDAEIAPHVRGIPVYPGDDNRTADEFLAAVDEALISGGGAKDDPEQLWNFVISRYSWQSAIKRYANIMSNLTPAVDRTALSRQFRKDIL